MSRKPRFTLPGIPQHIVQRGHNREPCFFDCADYLCYLDNMQKAANNNDCAIHAYCLMTNHVHILLTPITSYGISHMMQDIGRKYVRYINHTYQRSGTLWGGRFKASLVDSEAYLLKCMRYIEMNPVRAGMVQHPGEYRWSSYASNGYGRANNLITPHPLYIGLDDGDEIRLQCYRELFNAHLASHELHAIREALNQELVLGRDDFKEKIAAMTKRQTRTGVSGRPRVEDEEGVYYV